VTSSTPKEVMVVCGTSQGEDLITCVLLFQKKETIDTRLIKSPIKLDRLLAKIENKTVSHEYEL